MCQHSGELARLTIPSLSLSLSLPLYLYLSLSLYLSFFHSVSVGITEMYVMMWSRKLVKINVFFSVFQCERGSALHEAAMCGKSEMVQLLLDKGMYM